MLNPTNFTKEIVACYYSFRSSHILVGGVTSDRTLVIHSEQSFTNAPVDQVAAVLRGYKLPVWCNIHEPLKAVLGAIVRGELNFEKENEIERKSLDDLFDSLKYSRRLIKFPEVKLQAVESQHCLKILLKGLMLELCAGVRPVKFEAGEPSEFYDLIDRYSERF